MQATRRDPGKDLHKGAGEGKIKEQSKWLGSAKGRVKGKTIRALQGRRREGDERKGETGT